MHVLITLTAYCIRCTLGKHSRSARTLGIAERRTRWEGWYIAQPTGVRGAPARTLYMPRVLRRLCGSRVLRVVKDLKARGERKVEEQQEQSPGGGAENWKVGLLASCPPVGQGR